MMPNKTSPKFSGVERAIASFTLFFFLTQSTGLSQPEISRVFDAAREFVRPAVQIEIPRELGEIQSVFEAPQSESLILHLQDAHGNYEAQKNIEALIQHLVEKYHFKLLLLEGANEKLDPSLFHFFEDHNLNLQVADILMRHGEFTGAEKFLLKEQDPRSKMQDASKSKNLLPESWIVNPGSSSQSVSAYGIEDSRLYRRDIRLFRKVQKAKEVSGPFLTRLQSSTNVLESRFFSNDLRGFLKEWRKYRESGAYLTRFIDVLNQSAAKHLPLNFKDPLHQDSYPALIRILKLKDLESKLDAKKIGEEKEAILNLVKGKINEKLYRELSELDLKPKEKSSSNPRFLLEKVDQAMRSRNPKFSFKDYPHFSLFAAYLVFQHEVQSKELFKEVDEVTEKLFQVLAKTDKERTLLQVIKDTLLLAQLFSLELSRDEYEEIVKRREEFRPANVVARVSALSKTQDSKSKSQNKNSEPGSRILNRESWIRDLGSVNGLFHHALDFYHFAEEREQHFMDKAIETMKRENQSRAILITGGFHTKGLEERIKAKGLSYMRVSPEVKEVGDSHEVYLRAMLGRNKQIDQSQIVLALHLISAVAREQLLAKKYAEIGKQFLASILLAVATGAHAQLRLGLNGRPDLARYIPSQVFSGELSTGHGPFAASPKPEFVAASLGVKSMIPKVVLENPGHAEDDLPIGSLSSQPTILVTGGAGFIGSNFVRYLLATHPSYKVIVLDKFTYASRPENLEDIQQDTELSPRLEIVNGDVRDKTLVSDLVKKVDAVIHFAGESHVDRSNVDAQPFVQTNIDGTQNLLEVIHAQNQARILDGRNEVRLVHISTDEVYGGAPIGEDRNFIEATALEPKNPYAVTKAQGDLLVQQFNQKSNLGAIIIRPTNNFGPYQYPEKLLPFAIVHRILGLPIPLRHPEGMRDWLSVWDMARAVDAALHRGGRGEIFNVAGRNQTRNEEVVHIVLDLMGVSDQSKTEAIHAGSLRPGHDAWYPVNDDKLRTTLGWNSVVALEEGLKDTVDWYVHHVEWWLPILKTQSFKDFNGQVYSQDRQALTTFENKVQDFVTTYQSGQTAPSLGLSALKWKDLGLGLLMALGVALTMIAIKFMGAITFSPATPANPMTPEQSKQLLQDFYHTVILPTLNGTAFGYIASVLIHEIGHAVAAGANALPFPSRIGIVWWRQSQEGLLVPIRDQKVREAGTVASGVGVLLGLGLLLGSHMGWWTVTNLPFLFSTLLVSALFLAIADQPDQGIWKKEIPSPFEWGLPALIAIGTAVWALSAFVLGNYGWALNGGAIGIGLMGLAMIVERVKFGGVELRTGVRRDWQMSEREFIGREVRYTYEKVTGLNPQDEEFKTRADELADRFTANTYPSNQRAFFDAWHWITRIARAAVLAFLGYLLAVLLNFRSAITMVKFLQLRFTSYFHPSDAASQIGSYEEYQRILQHALPGQGGRIHADIALRWALEKGGILPHQGVSSAPTDQTFLTGLEVELRAGLREYVHRLSEVPSAIQREVERILASGKTPFRLEDITPPGLGPLWEYLTIGAMVLLAFFVARYTYHHFKSTAGYYNPPPIDLVRRHRYQKTAESTLEAAHELVHAAAHEAENRKPPLLRHDTYGATLVELVRSKELRGKMQSPNLEINRAVQRGRELANQLSLEEAVARAFQESARRHQEAYSAEHPLAEKQWGYVFGATLAGILDEKAQGNPEKLWLLVRYALLRQAPGEDDLGLSLRGSIDRALGAASPARSVNSGGNVPAGSSAASSLGEFKQVFRQAFPGATKNDFATLMKNLDDYVGKGPSRETKVRDVLKAVFESNGFKALTMENRSLILPLVLALPQHAKYQIRRALESLQKVLECGGFNLLVPERQKIVLQMLMPIAKGAHVFSDEGFDNLRTLIDSAFFKEAVKNYGEDMFALLMVISERAGNETEHIVTILEGILETKTFQSYSQEEQKLWIRLLKFAGTQSGEPEIMKEYYQVFYNICGLDPVAKGMSPSYPRDMLNRLSAIANRSQGEEMRRLITQLNGEFKHEGKNAAGQEYEAASASLGKQITPVSSEEELIQKLTEGEFAFADLHDPDGHGRTQILARVASYEIDGSPVKQVVSLEVRYKDEQTQSVHVRIRNWDGGSFLKAGIVAENELSAGTTPFSNPNAVASVHSQYVVQHVHDRLVNTKSPQTAVTSVQGKDQASSLGKRQTKPEDIVYDLLRVVSPSDQDGFARTVFEEFLREFDSPAVASILALTTLLSDKNGEQAKGEARGAFNLRGGSSALTPRDKVLAALRALAEKLGLYATQAENALSRNNAYGPEKDGILAALELLSESSHPALSDKHSALSTLKSSLRNIKPVSPQKLREGARPKASSLGKSIKKLWIVESDMPFLSQVAKQWDANVNVLTLGSFTEAAVNLGQYTRSGKMPDAVLIVARKGDSVERLVNDINPPGKKKSWIPLAVLSELPQSELAVLQRFRESGQIIDFSDTIDSESIPTLLEKLDQVVRNESLRLDQIKTELDALEDNTSLLEWHRGLARLKELDGDYTVDVKITLARGVQITLPIHKQVDVENHDLLFRYLAAVAHALSILYGTDVIAIGSGDRLIENDAALAAHVAQVLKSSFNNVSNFGFGLKELANLGKPVRVIPQSELTQPQTFSVPVSSVDYQKNYPGRYLGIDIGGSYIKFHLINHGLEELLPETLQKIETAPEFHARGKETGAQFVYRIIHHIERIREETGDIDGAAIVIPGAIDKATNRNVTFGQVRNTKNWNETDIEEARKLHDRVAEVLEKPVIVRNDMDGIGQAVASILGIQNAYIAALGTGLGTQVIVNGKLLDAPTELGHVVTDFGKDGMVYATEATTSIPSILKVAGQKGFQSPAGEENKVKPIGDAANNALDPQHRKALEILEGMAPALAQNFITVYELLKATGISGVNEVVLAGGVTSGQTGKIIADLVTQELAKAGYDGKLSVRVIPEEQIDVGQIGAVGAAILAARNAQDLAQPMGRGASLGQQGSYQTVVSEETGTRFFLGAVSNTLKDMMRGRYENMKLKRNESDFWANAVVLPPKLFEGLRNYGESEFLTYFNSFVQNSLFNPKIPPLRVIGTQAQIKALRGYLEHTIFGPDWSNSKIYPWLSAKRRKFFQIVRDEYAVAPGPGQKPFPFESYLTMIPFDGNRQATLDVKDETGNTKAVLKVRQDGPSKREVNAYKITQEKDGVTEELGELKVRYDLPKPLKYLDTPEKVAAAREEIKRAKEAAFAETWFGTSTGFDPTGDPTSFILWFEGKGIWVDPSHEALQYMEELGISDEDIPYVLLTHVHQDHDGGLLERIFLGKKVNLIASRLVYEEFKAKANFLLPFVSGHLKFEDLVTWKEEFNLDPDNKKPLKLKMHSDGKTIRLKSWWNFHPIPTNGFWAEYDGFRYYHSGDTEWPSRPRLIQRLIAEKVLSKARAQHYDRRFWRKDGTLHKYVNALRHEAGGPPIHTTLGALQKLAEVTKRIMRIYHLPNGQVKPEMGLEKAEPFKTTVFVPSAGDKYRVGNLLNNALVRMKGNQGDEFLKVFLAKAGKKIYQPRETLILEGERIRVAAFNGTQALIVEGTGSGRDEGRVHFIVKGRAAVYVGDEKKVVLGPGNQFGDWAIATGEPRAATVSVEGEEPLEVYTLTPAAFLELFGDPETIKRIRWVRENIEVLEEWTKNTTDRLFQDLGNFALEVLAGNAEKRVYQDGDVIIREGDQGDEVFLVVTGVVEILKGKGPDLHSLVDDQGRLAVKGRADLFGEIAILRDTERTATARAQGEVTVLVFKKAIFLALLEHYPLVKMKVEERIDQEILGLIRDYVEHPQFEDTSTNLQELRLLLVQLALRYNQHPDLLRVLLNLITKEQIVDLFSGQKGEMVGALRGLGFGNVRGVDMAADTTKQFLIKGDVTNLKEQIADASIDVAFITNYLQNDRMYEEHKKEFYDAVANEVNRILKPGGVLYLISGDEADPALHHFRNAGLVVTPLLTGGFYEIKKPEATPYGGGEKPETIGTEGGTASSLGGNTVSLAKEWSVSGGNAFSIVQTNTSQQLKHILKVIQSLHLPFFNLPSLQELSTNLERMVSQRRESAQGGPSIQNRQKTLMPAGPQTKFSQNPLRFFQPLRADLLQTLDYSPFYVVAAIILGKLELVNKNIIINQISVAGKSPAASLGGRFNPIRALERALTPFAESTESFSGTSLTRRLFISSLASLVGMAGFDQRAASQPAASEPGSLTELQKTSETALENALLKRPLLREVYPDTYQGVLTLRASNGMPYNQARGLVPPSLLGWLKAGDIGFMWMADMLAAANYNTYKMDPNFNPERVTARIRSSLELYQQMVQQFGLKVNGKNTGVLPEVLLHRGGAFETEEWNIPGMAGKFGVSYAAYDMGLTIERLMRLAEIFKGGIIPGLKDEKIAELAKSLVDQTNFNVFINAENRLHPQVFVTHAGEFVKSPLIIGNKHTEAKMLLPLIYQGMLGAREATLEERIRQGELVWEKLGFSWYQRQVGAESLHLATGDGGASAWAEFYGNLFYDEAKLAPRSEGVSHANYFKAAQLIAKERGHKVFISAPGTGRNQDEYKQFGLGDPSVTVPAGPFLALTTGFPEAVANVERLISLNKAQDSYRKGWGMSDSIDPLTGMSHRSKRIFMNQVLQLEALNYSLLRSIESRMPWYESVAKALQQLDKDHPAPGGPNQKKPDQASSLGEEQAREKIIVLKEELRKEREEGKLRPGENLPVLAETLEDIAADLDSGKIRLPYGLTWKEKPEELEGPQQILKSQLLRVLIFLEPNVIKDGIKYYDLTNPIVKGLGALDFNQPQLQESGILDAPEKGIKWTRGTFGSNVRTEGAFPAILEIKARHPQTDKVYQDKIYIKATRNQTYGEKDGVEKHHVFNGLLQSKLENILTEGLAKGRIDEHLAKEALRYQWLVSLVTPRWEDPRWIAARKNIQSLSPLGRFPMVTYQPYFPGGEEGVVHYSELTSLDEEQGASRIFRTFLKEMAQLTYQGADNTFEHAAPESGVPYDIAFQYTGRPGQKFSESEFVTYAGYTPQELETILGEHEKTYLEPLRQISQDQYEAVSGLFGESEDAMDQLSRELVVIKDEMGRQFAGQGSQAEKVHSLVFDLVDLLKARWSENNKERIDLSVNNFDSRAVLDYFAYLAKDSYFKNHMPTGSESVLSKLISILERQSTAGPASSLGKDIIGKQADSARPIASSQDVSQSNTSLAISHNPETAASLGEDTFGLSEDAFAGLNYILRGKIPEGRDAAAKSELIQSLENLLGSESLDGADQNLIKWLLAALKRESSEASQAEKVFDDIRKASLDFLIRQTIGAMVEGEFRTVVEEVLALFLDGGYRTAFDRIQQMITSGDFQRAVVAANLWNPSLTPPVRRLEQIALQLHKLIPVNYTLIAGKKDTDYRWSQMILPVGRSGRTVAFSPEGDIFLANGYSQRFLAAEDTSQVHWSHSYKYGYDAVIDRNHNVVVNNMEGPMDVLDSSDGALLRTIDRYRGERRTRMMADANGDVLIAEANSDQGPRIRKLSAADYTYQEPDIYGFDVVADFAIGNEGEIYILNVGDPAKYAPGVYLMREWGKAELLPFSSEIFSFGTPVSIAVDKEGNLHVAYGEWKQNPVIRVFEGDSGQILAEISPQKEWEHSPWITRNPDGDIVINLYDGKTLEHNLYLMELLNKNGERKFPQMPLLPKVHDEKGIIVKSYQHVNGLYEEVFDWIFKMRFLFIQAEEHLWRLNDQGIQDYYTQHYPFNGVPSENSSIIQALVKAARAYLENENRTYREAELLKEELQTILHSEIFKAIIFYILNNEFMKVGDTFTAEGLAEKLGITPDLVYFMLLPYMDNDSGLAREGIVEVVGNPPTATIVIGGEQLGRRQIYFQKESGRYFGPWKGSAKPSLQELIDHLKSVESSQTNPAASLGGETFGLSEDAFAGLNYILRGKIPEGRDAAAKSELIQSLENLLGSESLDGADQNLIKWLLAALKGESSEASQAEKVFDDIRKASLDFLIRQTIGAMVEGEFRTVVEEVLALFLDGDYRTAFDRIQEMRTSGDFLRASTFGGLFEPSLAKPIRGIMLNLEQIALQLRKLIPVEYTITRGDKDTDYRLSPMLLPVGSSGRTVAFSPEGDIFLANGYSQRFLAAEDTSQVHWSHSYKYGYDAVIDRNHNVVVNNMEGPMDVLDSSDGALLRTIDRYRGERRTRMMADANGDVLVAEANSDQGPRIRKLSAADYTYQEPDIYGFDVVADFAIGNEGEVYILNVEDSDREDDEEQPQYAPGVYLMREWGKAELLHFSSEIFSFGTPISIAVDKEGNLHVAYEEWKQSPVIRVFESEAGQILATISLPKEWGHSPWITRNPDGDIVIGLYDEETLDRNLYLMELLNKNGERKFPRSPLLPKMRDEKGIIAKSYQHVNGLYEEVFDWIFEMQFVFLRRIPETSRRLSEEEIARSYREHYPFNGVPSENSPIIQALVKAAQFYLEKGDRTYLDEADSLKRELQTILQPEIFKAIIFYIINNAFMKVGDQFTAEELAGKLGITSDLAYFMLLPDGGNNTGLAREGIVEVVGNPPTATMTIGGAGPERRQPSFQKVTGRDFEPWEGSAKPSLQELIDHLKSVESSQTNPAASLGKEKQGLGIRVQRLGEKIAQPPAHPFADSRSTITREIPNAVLEYSESDGRANAESIIHITHDVTFDIYWLEGATAVVVNYYKEKLGLVKQAEVSQPASEAIQAVKEGVLKYQDVLDHLNIQIPQNKMPMIVFVNEIFGGDQKELTKEEVARLAGKVARGMNQGDFFLGVVNRKEDRLFMQRLYREAVPNHFRAKAVDEKLLSDSVVASATKSMTVSPVSVSDSRDAGDKQLSLKRMVRVRLDTKAFANARFDIGWAVGLLRQIADNPENFKKLHFRYNNDGTWEAGRDFIALMEKVYTDLKAQNKFAVAA